MQAANVATRGGVAVPTSGRARKIAGRWLGFVPLTIAAIIVVAPVLWTITTSLRTPAESFTLPPQWFPVRPEWDNYAAVFTTIPYARYVLNSATVCVAVVLGQLFTATLAGYAFGANHIIWVVGAQKIVRNVDEGLRRIWEYSYPLENERMQTLYGVDSFPNKMLLVQGEWPGRISVLLVKEALGF